MSGFHKGPLSIRKCCPAKRGVRMDTLDVGLVTGETPDGRKPDVFVGFPPEMYDRQKTYHNGRMKHCLMLRKEEAEQLAGMLLSVVNSN